MKKLMLLIFGALLVGCSATENLPAPVQDLSVEVVYDEFDDITNFRSGEARVYSGSEEWVGLFGGGSQFRHRIFMRASLSCEGNVTNCKNPEVVLILNSLSDHGWKLLRNDRLVFILDEERYSFGEAYSDRETIRGNSVRETFGLILNIDEFEKIAFSEDVRARIGEFELNTSWERREILRVVFNEALNQTESQSGT